MAVGFDLVRLVRNLGACHRRPDPRFAVADGRILSLVILVFPFIVPIFYKGT